MILPVFPSLMHVYLDYILVNLKLEKRPLETVMHMARKEHFVCDLCIDPLPLKFETGRTLLILKSVCDWERTIYI